MGKKTTVQASTIWDKFILILFELYHESHIWCLWIKKIEMRKSGSLLWAVNTQEQLYKVQVSLFFGGVLYFFSLTDFLKLKTFSFSPQASYVWFMAQVKGD